MSLRRSCSTGIPLPHRSHFLRVEKHSLRVARDSALRASSFPPPSPGSSASHPPRRRESLPRGRYGPRGPSPHLTVGFRSNKSSEVWPGHSRNLPRERRV